MKNDRPQITAGHFYSCSFSFWILNHFLRKNPKNFGLLTTTTFIRLTSNYVQRLHSAIPSERMITAMINMISPVGQKKEMISPKPNAIAYCALQNLGSRMVPPPYCKDDAIHPRLHYSIYKNG